MYAALEDTCTFTCPFTRAPSFDRPPAHTIVLLPAADHPGAAAAQPANRWRQLERKLPGVGRWLVGGTGGQRQFSLLGRQLCVAGEPKEHALLGGDGQ